MPKSKVFNPFYGLLVVIGVVFVVTACAYFVMTLRGTRPESSAPAHPLMTAVEEYGLTALVVELIVLGIATFGAIGTDDYWERRRRKQVAADRETVSPEDETGR